jgi:hypothetical protein
MAHPAFPGCPEAFTSHWGVETRPLNMPLFVALHPEVVCRAMLFASWELTPSIMSISPAFGQFEPTVQKAGHVPQTPPGMWFKSKMMRPWL